MDRRIVEILAADARTPNNAIAESVGIAASTCLGRVRSLVSRGVIRGFHADVAPEALGRHLRAVVAIRLQPQARPRIGSIADRLAELPQVVDVFFLAGADDFLVHVLVEDTAALRDFVVVNLSESPDVAGTQTSVVFEHRRNPLL